MADVSLPHVNVEWDMAAISDTPYAAGLPLVNPLDLASPCVLSNAPLSARGVSENEPPPAYCYPGVACIGPSSGNAGRHESGFANNSLPCHSDFAEYWSRDPSFMPGLCAPDSASLVQDDMALRPFHAAGLPGHAGMVASTPYADEAPRLQGSAYMNPLDAAAPRVVASLAPQAKYADRFRAEPPYLQDTRRPNPLEMSAPRVVSNRQI